MRYFDWELLFGSREESQYFIRNVIFASVRVGLAKPSRTHKIINQTQLWVAVNIKGEVYPKIKFSPVVVFGVLSRMVLVRGSWDAPFLLESQSNSRTSTETGWLRPTRWGFVCKMSLKAPFRSYKSTDDRDWPICCSLLDAESTGFGSKRLRCSVPPLFPIEHGWTSGHVLLRTPVSWSPCLQGTTY